MGDNIKLRGFREEDAAILVTLCNNKKIWDNVRDQFPHPYTQKDAVSFIEKMQNEKPQYTFVIQFNNDLVGCIGFIPQTDVYRLSAEIGYWVGEPYWGKGIVTEAIKKIVDYGFNELNLIRIYAGCFDFNVASQRVLLKAGFQKEGISKKAIVKNGIIRDEIRYALVKSDD